MGLKPCPFCDRKPVIAKINERCFTVTCKCGAESPKDSVSIIGAKRIWNRRRGDYKRTRRQELINYWILSALQSFEDSSEYDLSAISELHKLIGSNVIPYADDYKEYHIHAIVDR